MPVFVIHAMAQPAKKMTATQQSIVVGRDASAVIVLPGKTVSRQHAVFESDPHGRWSVRCLSATNAIVVDGALTTASAFVSEGSEVLIGTEYLLIFSDNDHTASQYLGTTSYFSKSQCSRCGWRGMISSLRRAPVCPKCAGSDLVSEHEYQRPSAAQDAPQGPTTAVSPSEVKARLNRLKAARRSRLERVDGKALGTGKRDLNEDKTVRMAKDERAEFPMTGFMWGKGVEIAWDGQAYVAQSQMVFPAMKVNGTKHKRTRLRNGDVIEVGSNRVRFVTE